MLLLDKCKRKERMNYMNEFEKVLIDSQKEVGKSNKRKDKIIVLLIVLMFLEAIVGYSGFIWYESQFDYVTTEQETQDVDLSTEGDNANAEYNDVQGNQYNDRATHNEQ
jgi:flagellar basal body-associated protein FliL